MKKLLIAIPVIVVVIVGALLALPLLIPTETVKAELIARIEDATGRKARIDGPISIGILPTAHVSAKGIGLAGLIGDSDAFTVDSVSFGLNLLPLISGNVVINAVTIERPAILLEVAANGQTNWSARVSGEPAPKTMEELLATDEPGGEPPPAAAPAEVTPMNAAQALERLSIGHVTIKDGTFTWRDQASGTSETVIDVNLDVDLPRIAGAGSLDGSFTWRGVVETLKASVGERPAAEPFVRVPLDFSLTSDALALSAKGIVLDGDTVFGGTIAASGPSLAAVATLAGAGLPNAAAFGKFDLTSDLSATGGQVRLQELAGDFGGMKITGAAAVAFDRARPGLAVKLHADRIDTAAFTGVAGESSAGGGAAPASDAIDFSPLKFVDANADFSADEVVIGSVSVKNLGIEAQLVGGALQTTIRSVEINGAPGSGSLAIDASGATPMLSGSVKMSGLDLAGLMALAGQSAPVSGAAGFDVTFRTSGDTTAALAQNMEASGKVSLADGRVTGLGLASSVGGDTAADTLEDVDATAAFASLSSPVTVDGGATWRGERFNLSANADARALLAGTPTNVTVKANSSRVNFGYAGTAGLAGVGKGTVSLSTPSLRNLLAWIGQPMSAGGGLQAFSIEGAVALTATSFAFDKASFSLDSSSGTGTGKVDFGGKPSIEAGLAMSVLDVTPYLVAAGASDGGGAKTGGAGNGGGGGGAGGGGKAGKAGPWSSAKIGFDGLQSLDARLNVRAEKIVASDIMIGPAELALTIAGGKLEASLPQMALYSGTGTGLVTIDGAASPPAVGASFKLAGVSVAPFLADTLGITRIEGTGSFNFDVATSGGSEAALVNGLNGQGALRFANGAIRGINIPKMVQSLSVETLLGWQAGNDKTDFDDMSATFTVVKGIVTNKDLAMSGPLFTITGAGTIDMPQQMISYRVEPKVIPGQGKKGKKEGFAVPVKIEGSWDKPRIYPEIEGILENPGKALDQLRNLGGGLFGDLGGDGGGNKKKNGGGGKAKSQPAADTTATPGTDPQTEPATDATLDKKPKKKQGKNKGKNDPADLLKQLVQ